MFGYLNLCKVTANLGMEAIHSVLDLAQHLEDEMRRNH